MFPIDNYRIILSYAINLHIYVPISEHIYRSQSLYVVATFDTSSISLIFNSSNFTTPRSTCEKITKNWRPTALIIGLHRLTSDRYYETAKYVVSWQLLPTHTKGGQKLIGFAFKGGHFAPLYLLEWKINSYVSQIS